MAVFVAGLVLITVDARVVIASIGTYLRFAEAVNRLDLGQTEMAGIDALRDGGKAGEQHAKGAVEGAKERSPPKSAGLRRTVATQASPHWPESTAARWPVKRGLLSAVEQALAAVLLSRRRETVAQLMQPCKCL